MKERLQKILAECGLASRREAEGWIRAGRLTVNGEAAVLGTKADPARDAVCLDGRRLALGAPAKRYLAFHKPRNVMVTRRDPQGRPTIYTELGEVAAGLHPVGRLDFDSEGLLLLSNDGEFTLRASHPRYEVTKAYEVKATVGANPAAVVAQLQRGVKLEDGLARPHSVRLLKQNPHNAWLEIVLAEGRNREIRRLCAAAGLKVLRLKRVAIGPVRLGALAPGAARPLTPAEIRGLMKP